MFRNFLIFAFGLILGSFFYVKIPENLVVPNSSTFYDRNGNIIFQNFDTKLGYYEKISFEEIPDFARDITIKLEDKRFFYHPGFDPIAISRALIQNLQGKRVISGGSGITQQLIRNHLQPRKRNIFYKCYELILAVKTEMFFSKKQILEAYLNSISYGNNATGIGAASKLYFNKSPKELSIKEMIFLAGLPQSPVAYSPFLHLQKALQREKTVENILSYNRFFEKYCPLSSTRKQCIKEILKSPIRISRGKFMRKAHHAIELVEKELKQILPNTPHLKNLKIYTSLDLGLIESIENISRKQLEENKEKNLGNTASVVLDNENKSILALIGSADYFDESIQGAVNNAISLRQPGSTVKALTYALAFEQGDTPDSLVSDSFYHATTQEGYPYEPKNYDFKEYGNVTYRQALANSYNISAIQVAEKVGIPKLLDTFRAVGFSELKKSAQEYGSALTLGDGEVSLLDLTKAYSIFPLKGQKFSFHIIEKIEENGNIIFSASQANQGIGEHIFSQKSTDYINDILSDNFARSQQFGEDSPLKTSQWSAVKTGTTRNYRDNWTIGYNKAFTVGVWVGNSDGSYLRNSTGVSGAAPIWHDTMEILFKTPMSSSDGVRHGGRRSGALGTESANINIKENPSQKIPQPDLHLQKNNESSTILLPQEGDVYLLEHSSQEAIIFKAKKEVFWKLDGKDFGKGEKLFWKEATLGKHCIEAENEKKCFRVIE